jgi:hypothetical protein
MPPFSSGFLLLAKLSGFENVGVIHLGVGVFALLLLTDLST